MAEDMMDLQLKKLIEATDEIIDYLNRWENDPALIPLIRPNKDKASLETRETLTRADLEERLEHNQVYLIYLDGQLIGEMDYQIDPRHLYKKEPGTAWIGIIIGEAVGRGKGVGYLAIQYLEEQIRRQGLKRVELGVFEFNTNALRLYQNLGYQEIGRVPDFTLWQGKMWQDIRMEKYLQGEADRTK
jgi:RimJ/RimL family protein N-acetyltransferase